MPTYDDLEKQVSKKYKPRDKKVSKPKMKVSGKSVFGLKKIIETKHDRTFKRKSS